MSEAWIGEACMFDFEKELLCEKTGYCDPRYCPYVIECFDDRGFYYCPFCGKKTFGLSSLKVHAKMHIGNYCPICGKKYRFVARHAFNKYLKTGDNHHLVLYYLASTPFYARKTPYYVFARNVTAILTSNNLVKF